jgi:hypothetical protein
MRHLLSFLIALTSITPLFAAEPPAAPPQSPPASSSPDLTAHLQAQLKNIAPMSLSTVPKDAQLKRFARIPVPPAFVPQPFSAWLLSQDGQNFKIVDLYGRNRLLPCSQFTIANRQIDDELQTFTYHLNQRRNTRNTGQRPNILIEPTRDNPVPDQPQYISAPESLMALWTLERGDTKTAAAILQPCLDAAPSLTVIETNVRDQLARAYYVEMVYSFFYDHDPARALAIADHLTTAPFRDIIYATRIRDFKAQIPARAHEFKTLLPPSLEEWEKLKPTLDRTAQIHYLASRLRLRGALTQSQSDQRSRLPYYNRHAPHIPDENAILRLLPIDPRDQLAGMKLQVNEIPILLPYLDDRSFCVLVDTARTGYSFAAISQVNVEIAQLINAIATRMVINPQQLSTSDPKAINTIKQDTLKWIAANTHLTRNQHLLASLAATHDLQTFFPLACELTVNRETAALPLILKEIENQQRGYDKSRLAELCCWLAPERCVGEARKWASQTDEKYLQIWGALILFRAGDATRKEGYEKLALLLPSGPNHDYYHLAQQVLIRSPHPEALDLLAPLLQGGRSIYHLRYFAPCLRKLFLAGRQDAFDFLLSTLDNSTFAGSTGRVTKDGKRYDHITTQADDIAASLNDFRTDFNDYPQEAPRLDRAAHREVLKQWLTDQFALIKAGKPSAIKPLPDPTSLPLSITNPSSY